MYGELASIREAVDLSPKEALDAAEGFLARLGYDTLSRDDASLIVKRDEPERPLEKGVLNLKVVVYPQPKGGVLIKVRGNDQEGAQQHQDEWARWAEGFPKKGADRPASDAKTLAMPPAGSSEEDAASTRSGGEARPPDAEAGEDENLSKPPPEGRADGTGLGLD